jgi:hypothetical protein
MIQTIINLAILMFGVYYYYKYNSLKNQTTTSPIAPTGDEPNDNPQVTSVPEKQISDL